MRHNHVFFNSLSVRVFGLAGDPSVAEFSIVVGKCPLAGDI